MPEGGGVPAGWTLSGSAEIGLEKTGAVSRLKLTVIRAGKDQGALSQTIDGLPPDTRLVLTGKVRGSKDKMAYLQIKLKEGKKEIKRFNSALSATGENELRIEFSTLNATSLSAQCRFSQESAGESVWLSDLKLTTVPR